MGNQKALAAVAVVVGIIFLGLAVLYWTQPASALPSFVPGHEAGVAAKHTKHGIAALALAIIAFLIAWFQSGPKAAAPRQ